ncbi:adenylyltransferase/cytidyltransferase family protein [Halorhodospira sp. 9622]|uniref:adenylyltransferase/cytidyltransferase family protein n=1 Tax=Halorhodospira sp. 9622 TaxID=2899136 RepID=UPI001EE900CB|nr:adenylyltransferase/cytidyltransferase family protein [Halorhodospira sp. 9622]MCG5538613.1 adenylyltransferase/cytidyltransferase family protein [Halorhodospira sp. 9622]
MKSIGYTTGVYDMFHIGHLNLLRRAKFECDYLIVGVTTDELCERVKGKKPIIPFAERMEIVKHIDFVDEALPQTSMDKMEAWNNLKFDKIFVGDDWRGSDKWNQLEKEFGEVGVEIAYFPYTRHTSSTKLRQVVDRITSADMAL